MMMKCFHVNGDCQIRSKGLTSSGYDDSKCEQGINTVTPVITSNNVSEQTAPLQSDPDQQAMIAVWV